MNNNQNSSNESKINESKINESIEGIDPQLLKPIVKGLTDIVELETGIKIPFKEGTGRQSGNFVSEDLLKYSGEVGNLLFSKIWFEITPSKPTLNYISFSIELKYEHPNSGRNGNSLGIDLVFDTDAKEFLTGRDKENAIKEVQDLEYYLSTFRF